MRKIWKYELDLGRPFTELEIPAGSRALSVGQQRVQGEVRVGCPLNIAVIWFEVTPSAEKVPAKIALVMTGDEVPEGNWHFVGSVLMAEGSFVVHVYLPVELT